MSSQLGAQKDKDLKVSKSGVEVENMEVNNETEVSKQTPYRLRNHSYQQANSINNAVPSQLQQQQCAGSADIPLSAIDEETTGNEMGSMEDIISPKILIRKEDWQGKSSTVKLDTVFESINKMYAVQQKYHDRLKPLEYAVFHKEDGILPQLSKIASFAEDAGTKQSDLTADNLQLREELEIVKGVVSKQGKQIASLQNRLADQVARSMENHLIISGILNDSRDADDIECIALFVNFAEEQLEIECEREEISAAYRYGLYDEKRARPMVIKVTEELKRKIFRNTPKLGSKTNANDRPFSVNPMLPDQLTEQRREIRQIIKEKKDSEKSLPKAQKSSFLVRNGRVFINGQLKRKVLTPPDIRDLFVSSDEQLKINRIKTKTVDEPPVKGNKFRAVAVLADTLNEVHLSYIKMFQLYPHADHIVAAFAVGNEEGYQDNGEFGAGFRTLNVIREAKLLNVAVFIIREFSGNHLGPLRFDVMRRVAGKALQALS